MGDRLLRRKFATAWLAVLILGGCLWWGVHPPRTEDSYRSETVQTVELMRSNVETARLWLAAMEDGKVTTAAAAVALTETEIDASSQISTYSSYQPPNQPTTRLRTEVTEAGDHVVALLGEVRIAALAGRWADAFALRAELASVSEKLRDLHGRAEP